MRQSQALKSYLASELADFICKITIWYLDRVNRVLFEIFMTLTEAHIEMVSNTQDIFGFRIGRFHIYNMVFVLGVTRVVLFEILMTLMEAHIEMLSNTQDLFGFRIG